MDQRNRPFFLFARALQAVQRRATRNTRQIAKLVAFVTAGALLATPAARAGYASYVMDMETEQTLHAANADTRNYPASLTKMMTLYMTFEALESGRFSMNQRLPVSQRAEGMTPSKLGLKTGRTIAVKNAISALVTKSANDAAVVLAEAMGETEYKFALKMTRRARKLGMKRTTFRNASGLPNRGQLSTARDMAKLGKALIEDFPQYYDYFSTERFSYKGRTYGNHNNLLDSYRGTDGIKTGYIRASGFNLVASVKRNGRRLIGVVFGGRTARSRDRHMVKLLDKGFRKVQQLRQIQIVGPPTPKPEHLTGQVAARGTGNTQDAGEPLAVGDADPQQTARATAANESLGGPDAGAADLPVPTRVIRPKAVKNAARRLARAHGDFAIQVGAYSRASWAHDAAVQALNQAPQLLRTSRLSVTRMGGSSSPVYRARLADLSHSRARQACRLLESMGQDCLVIQPRGGVEVAFSN